MPALVCRILTRPAVGAAAMSAVLLGGCKHYTDYSAFIKHPRPVVSTTEYTLAPPDRIEIGSKRVREIDRTVHQIRPDGRINLDLLGEVFVAGRTTEEVAAEITAIARQYYEDADVTVRVVGFNSKKVFVFGEVSSPGRYTYDGTNTVLGTLARAQPTRLADPGRIQVLRPNADGDLRKRMTIDLNTMIKEGDTTLDAVLEEGDVIYVPPNGLAVVGLAIQQVLLPISPAASTARGQSIIRAEAGEEGGTVDGHR